MRAIINFELIRFLAVIIISISVRCQTDKNEFCVTKACELEAENIRSKLDETIDPCDDFYLFACGDFVHNTIIPDDKSAVDVTSLLQDSLNKKLSEVFNSSIMTEDLQAYAYSKKLYKACLDEGEKDCSGKFELETSSKVPSNLFYSRFAISQIQSKNAVSSQSKL